MGTQVRDAIVAALAKKAGEYFTAEDIAKKHTLNADSTKCTMRTLYSKGILSRRQVDGSREFEYTAGRRIAFGEKYAGRKFPFHRGERGNGEAIPAVSGGVGIVIKIDGTAHAITLSEARGIFNDLKALFG